jgi:hypothetical protein
MHCFSKWRPTWKMALHFRFGVLLTQHVLLSLCIKFHPNQAKKSRFTAIYWFSRWRQRKSSKLMLHFRFCVSCTRHVYISLCTKFITIGLWMADLQHSFDFQDGGYGHLWKWRYTSGSAFFWTRHVFLSLCTKCHHNRDIISQPKALHWFSRWWLRPSLKVALHSRFCVFLILHDFLCVPKFITIGL